MAKFKAGDIIRNRDGINCYEILDINSLASYSYKVLSHYTHYPEEAQGYWVGKFPKGSVHEEQIEVIDDNFELFIPNYKQIRKEIWLKRKK